MADTIGVLAAAGLQVRYAAEPIRHPRGRLAALEARARAAIVITARQNPAQDNDYKVYDANGVADHPPVDTDVVEAIAGVGTAGEVPLGRVVRR